MSATAMVTRKYKITGRDGTNVTLSQDEEPHGEATLPTTLTVAHGGNTSFWGQASGAERYLVGIDRMS